MRPYRKILYSPTAADLNERITISRISEELNTDGYRTEATLTPIRQCWAAVLYNSGLPVVAADAQQVKFDISFVIRTTLGTPVSVGMYVTWQEENYRITLVDDRRVGPLWTVLRAVKTGEGLTA